MSGDLYIFKMVMVVITVLISVLVLIMYISALISLVKGKRFTVSSIITLTLFAIAAVSYSYYAISNVYNDQDIILIIVRSIASISYGYGQEAMIFTFISRMNVIFHNSVLQISKRSSKCLYCTWFLTFILGSIAGILSNGQSIIKGAKQMLAVIASLWMLSYFPLAIYLIILFIHKLRILMINTAITTSVNSDISQNEQKDYINNMVDIELLHVIIKNSIIIPICIAFDLISVILALIIRVKAYDCPEILIFDLGLATLSLYLLFSVNDNIYNILCFKLHKFCLKCCISSINNKPEPVLSMSSIQSFVAEKEDKIKIENAESIDADININIDVDNKISKLQLSRNKLCLSNPSAPPITRSTKLVSLQSQLYSKSDSVLHCTNKS